MPGFADTLADLMVRMHIADESLPAGLMLHAFARAEGAFPRRLEEHAARLGHNPQGRRVAPAQANNSDSPSLCLPPASSSLPRE